MFYAGNSGDSSFIGNTDELKLYIPCKNSSVLYYYFIRYVIAKGSEVFVGLVFSENED